ncbi:MULTISPECIES: hypothetical protein [Bacillus]|uniref:hypothetical protein n=1 Tax=Bacillus TaxID=1386 RepID=UPI000D03EA8E|nr:MULTISPECIES: hypothetical protein [Bacillus]MCY7679871.1 hypothetical protein [Bacillus pumilus]PRS47504.1 hypothetical protein C6Y06_18305 [Bacillus sp. MZGC1]
MAINVTIHTSVLNHSGVCEGYKYNKLKLKETGGRRLYFAAINNGIRMTTLRKLMKLENGQVFVSFGNKKYEIGSYEEVKN